MGRARTPSATNAVLVLHALTGDSHAAGPPGPGHPTAGWWDGLIGPGAAIDTDRYFVVCPNVLGGCQGTTGPASLGARRRAPTAPASRSSPSATRWRSRSRWPTSSASSGGPASSAARWAACASSSGASANPSGSAGPWSWPSGAAASADQIALCSLQVRAIRSDPAFHGGDYYEHARTARSTGWRSPGASASSATGPATSSSSASGASAQGAEEPLKGGRYAVESYLQHHGDKLAERFDPNSYIDAQRGHEPPRRGPGSGRDRASPAEGPGRRDRGRHRVGPALPARPQQELARLLPGRPTLSVIESDFGHDGFLLEIEQVGRIVAAALD